MRARRESRDPSSQPLAPEVVRVWLLLALTAGVVTTLVVLFWRNFPLPLAIISGVGVAALTFMCLQTLQRLRDLFRPLQ